MTNTERNIFRRLFKRKSPDRIPRGIRSTDKLDMTATPPVIPAPLATPLKPRVVITEPNKPFKTHASVTTTSRTSTSGPAIGKNNTANRVGMGMDAIGAGYDVPAVGGTIPSSKCDTTSSSAPSHHTTCSAPTTSYLSAPTSYSYSSSSYSSSSGSSSSDSGGGGCSSSGGSSSF